MLLFDLLQVAPFGCSRYTSLDLYTFVVSKFEGLIPELEAGRKDDGQTLRTFKKNLTGYSGIVYILIILRVCLKILAWPKMAPFRPCCCPKMLIMRCITPLLAPCLDENVLIFVCNPKFKHPLKVIL
jgi:hypothetical protein